MNELEKIMQICNNALEAAGYETYGYTEEFGHFTVTCSGDEDVIVNFDTID